MRKFAFSLFAFVACVFVVQSAAQTRDLFAEFEAEAQAAEQPASSEAKVVPPSSSSVAPAATPAPVSSAAVSSSSVPVQTPSSSSATPVSSSVVVSSSSEEAPVSSSLAAPDSAVADTAKADSAKVDSAKVDSTKIKEYIAAVNAAMEKSRKQDSLAALSSSSSETALPSSSSMSRRDLLGPVKVSKVHGIDEMKGQYRSPRKALFLSLVIPGSGQLYVGGSKFTYARGVIYLALEAGLWAGWYYNSVYKYDKQVDKYKKFANEHYSIGRYENSMYDLFHSLNDASEESRFVERYMSSRQSFCEALYGSGNNRGCYTGKQLPYAKESDHKRNFGDNPENLDKERKKQDFYEASEVYQIIGGATYVLGWDDVDSVAIVDALDLADPNSETVSLGQSSNRNKYRSMRNKANDLADMQAWFIGGLILNHLVSAVDAALSANSHNKSLYEEDLSWYDRLRFDSGFSFFNGFGVDVRASWGF